MIKRERHLWTLFLLAAGLLTGCGSDDAKDNPNPVQPSESKQEIQLLATGKPFTRATTIDNDTELQSQDLKINAYHHGTETAYLSNATLHYDTDAWKFWSGSAETHYYWPTEGSIIGDITVSSLDFVGYCPYTQPAYISSLSYTYSGGITFTADMTQTHDTEFLYAYLPTQTYTTQTGEGGALPLQFQHPFAKIYFTLSDASGEAVTVKSISIGSSDIATTGSYTHGSGWSSVSGSGTLSGMSLNTPYIVIPNTYSSKTLTVNATWSDWSEVTTNVSTTITPTWVAGRSYTYNLTLTKYALKVDEEKYTEQW